MSRLKRVPAGEQYKYSSDEIGSIMKNGSKDRGVPVQVSAPDTSVFTKEIIHEYVRTQLPVEMTCLSDGPGSTPVQFTGCHAQVANTGPFFDYATTLVNMFFPSSVNDAISAVTGLPNTSIWYMSVRLYPTYKALRAAGISRIRISTEAQDFVRIGFVVPLNARNEEIRLVLINGRTGTASERVERALYNTGPNVFPPSVLRSQACYIHTSDPKGRAYERSENASVAVFILHLTSLEAPTSLLRNAIYNCTPHPGPPAATAVRISDLNRSKADGPAATKNEWNEDRTKIVRRAVTAKPKAGSGREYAEDQDTGHAVALTGKTTASPEYAEDNEEELHMAPAPQLKQQTFAPDSDEEPGPDTSPSMTTAPLSQNRQTYAPDDELYEG
jgi:hypothetical protein